MGLRAEMRFSLAALVAATCVLLVGPSAVANTGPGGLIKSCVKITSGNSSGNMRIIDGPGLNFKIRPAPCTRGIEVEVDWPSVGPKGPTGATGPMVRPARPELPARLVPRGRQG